MKKYFLIAIVGIGLLILACDKQKALKQIMSDPQVKSNIMGQMLADESIRAELADSVFADKKVIDAYINNLISNEYSKNDLLNRILRTDPTGQWIVSKLAEMPAIKETMKKAVK